MIIRTRLFLLSLLMCFGLPVTAHASTPPALSSFSQLENAGLLVLDAQGQAVLSKHANRLYIPASTTKLVTAWLALQYWGETHRFQTDFYWQPTTHTLWVKGRGDPFLVSEEIALIARQLKQRGIQRVDTLVLDTHIFQPNLVMPGTGRSNNPYDAVPSALAANFNTVNLKKVRGKVVSAEPQTPLTSIGRSLSARFKTGTLRVNTGRSPRLAEHYFAEILLALLQQQGIRTDARLVWGQVPARQPLFYRHSNRKTLGQMIRPMMKYSTNFIANQLILMLSAEHDGRPANAEGVQRYMQETLARHFGWQGFILKEGAGLSRENRLSPAQLVDLLQAFRPWAHLLPEVEPGVFAKSGTLNKVSTLAGYIKEKGQLKPFALMMNQGVPYKLRNRIARELARQ